MKSLLAFLFFLFLIPSFAQDSKRLKLRKGSWVSELKLNKSDVLPFNLLVKKKKKQYSFVVVNGDEQIILEDARFIGDSVFVMFPFFNSELVFNVKSRKEVSGYWYNYNKGVGYKIPFASYKSKANRFEPASKVDYSKSFSGNWKVTFEPGSSSAYPAVGIFNQNKNRVSGTFLTETGDYRYLEGNSYQDSLYLSCFDGSHAFLFKAKCKNDSLYGSFYSGNHWQSSWVAIKDSSFKLKNPEDLTYLKPGEDFKFSLPNLNGDTLVFPNEKFKNKVTIVQIMGSWCPNCLDETIYYKKLDSIYKDRGLEIISVAYENGDGFLDYKENVLRLIKKLDLDFTFLIGGGARKNLASEHFNVLSEIISFPTSIIIGRDGVVKRVHTGFNGPGTGEYYTKYVDEMNSFVESLLAN